MIYLWAQVICDGCRVTQILSRPDMGRWEIRRELSLRGWRRVGREDLCNACFATTRKP